MIRGIGIDSVEIARFKDWHTYPEKSLLRVFSKKEIAYCLQYKKLSAQRFAARFAAKEAFLKAISSIYPKQKYSLLYIFKAVTIIKNKNNSPQLIINWSQLPEHTQTPKSFLSITHNRTAAIAIIILQ